MPSSKIHSSRVFDPKRHSWLPRATEKHRRTWPPRTPVVGFGTATAQVGYTDRKAVWMNITFITHFVFTARCTLVQSAAVLPYILSVCVSVSVTFVHCDYKSSAVARWATVATIDTGIKRGGGAGAVPLSRSAGNPSNTMWPALRSTTVPSGVFIHPAVWPQ